MDRWDRDREVEKVKPAPASKLTADDAKAIAAAINGALGLALAKLTGSDGARGTPVAPETWAPTNKAPVGVQARDPNMRALERVTDTLAGIDGFEDLYQRIKRRLIDECRVDPILLHLLTTAAPELRIDVEPRTIPLEGASLRGRLALLVGAGFFDTARPQAEAIRELKRTGTEPHSGRTSEAFATLVGDGVLTREGEGYQKAPGVKVTKNVLTVV